MKVTITNESKKWLTLAEMPAAKKLIDEMKGSEYTLKEICEDAMNWIIAPMQQRARILECSASITRNNRVNDWHFEGSGKLDIWIEFIAFDSYFGCWECGVYLSDVWSVGEHNREETRSRCYIKKFEEV